MPKLESRISQIGVKEIFHTGWEMYSRHFPEMRVILLGRDPRDIYISLYHRWKNGTAAWSGSYTPERVANYLRREFRRQLQMLNTARCFKVRYEDLCQGSEIYNRIKEFADSPIRGIGEVGIFNKANQARINEYQLHGDAITARRVYRWKQEKDKALLANAQKVFDLMPEYCSFWGYEK